MGDVDSTIWFCNQCKETKKLIEDGINGILEV